MGSKYPPSDTSQLINPAPRPFMTRGDETMSESTGTVATEQRQIPRMKKRLDDSISRLCATIEDMANFLVDYTIAADSGEGKGSDPVPCVCDAADYLASKTLAIDKATARIHDISVRLQI